MCSLANGPASRASSTQNLVVLGRDLLRQDRASVGIDAIEAALLRIDAGLVGVGPRSERQT
jgi:hypothetical protein